MASTEFCIKWTNYQTNIVNSVGKLRKDDEFVDVTLVCDDKSITAHKVILSACSDYFKQVFKVNFLVESDVQTVFSGMQIVRVPWDHTRTTVLYSLFFTFTFVYDGLHRYQQVTQGSSNRGFIYHKCSHII